MKPSKTIRYKGRAYSLANTGYYIACSKRPSERALHRVVWIEHNGPIPLGMVVHHRDGNRTNNVIENLELKSHEGHMRDHALEKLANDPDYLEVLKGRLVKARAVGSTWSKTEEGREFCRQKMLAQLADDVDRAYTCRFCGRVFTASTFAKHHFCSQKCRNQSRYSSIKTSLESACVVCGSTFSHNEYYQPLTCSKNCRMLNRSLKLSRQH